MKTSFILTAILTITSLGGRRCQPPLLPTMQGNGVKRPTRPSATAISAMRYDALRGLLLDKTVVPAGNNLVEAVASLQRLNRNNEIDELLESAVKTHEGDLTRWSFLGTLNQYHQIPHQGFIVAGKFSRGPHRGGDGRPVNPTGTASAPCN